MIINHHFFRLYSPFPKNYDLSEIDNYIRVAEQIYIVPLLGDALYNEINEQVNSNTSGGTLSVENSTLLTEGGVWQLLGFATTWVALPLVWGTISENGIQLGKSDNSESMTLKDLTLVQQHLQQLINALRDKVITYLCTHTESFPLFDASICPNCNCCGHEPVKQLFKPLNHTCRRNKDIK